MRVILGISLLKTRISKLDRGGYHRLGAKGELIREEPPSQPKHVKSLLCTATVQKMIFHLLNKQSLKLPKEEEQGEEVKV